MQSVASSCLRQAVLLALLLSQGGNSAAAFDLFARHRVEVQFATAQGRPLADAEVRVFAPGRPDRPALTGHTDKDGKFDFSADEDGLWSAEARSGGEIARVTVRVGRPGQPDQPISPYWVLAGLVLLLALGFGLRIAAARRRPRP